MAAHSLLSRRPCWRCPQSLMSSRPADFDSSASSPSSPVSLSDYLTLAVSLSHAAGALILSAFHSRKSVSGIRQLERLRLLCTRHSLQSLRSYDSCSINVCYVAAGRAEAYYEGYDPIVGPKPWDSAAAALILTEAGGLVADTNGGAFDLTQGRVLAANNRTIAQVIIDACTEVERGETAQLSTERTHV